MSESSEEGSNTDIPSIGGTSGGGGAEKDHVRSGEDGSQDIDDTER